MGGSQGDALVVRVAAPAVDGRATEACLVALAEALGVRRSAIRLVSGARSRNKLVEADEPGPAPSLEATLGALRARAPR